MHQLYSSLKCTEKRALHQYNGYIFRHLTFIILIAIFQSKTPSLWLCYMKAYWKLFVYGGLLKFLGDLAALVGPISISRIVEYIQRNVSAPSLLTATTAIASLAEHAKSNTINGTDALTPITHNMTSAVNDAIKTGSNSNYDGLLSAAEYRDERVGHMMSALLINENTEIYYPSWSEFFENGWIMALLVLISSLAQGSFSQNSTHTVNMIGIRVRSSLQSLVYRKTLLISSSCFISPNLCDESSVHSNSSNVNDNENSNGSISTDAHETFEINNDTDDNNGLATNENSIHAADDKTKADPSDTVDDKSAQQSHEQPAIDTGTITNLMSEDALNVMSFFWIAHYVWAIPLKVCIQLIQQMAAF